VSLRLKVTAVVLGISLAATLLVAVLSLQATRAQLLDGVDQSLDRLAAQPVWDRANGGFGFLPPGRLGPSREELSPSVRNELLRVQIHQLDNAGDESGQITVLAGDSALDVEPATVSAAAAGETAHVTIRESATDAAGTESTSTFRAVARPLRAGDVLVVAQGITEDVAALQRLVRAVVAIGLLVAGVAAVVGWLVSGALLRPVRDLTRASEHISVSGDPDVRVATRSADEVGRLSRSMQLMLDSLTLSRRQQRQLVADAGHELRTPIATIMSNAEVLHRHPDVDADTREAIATDLISEAGELARLVDSLVELASVVESAEPASRESLAALVRQAVRGLPVPDRDRVEVHGDADATVYPVLLRRALVNVLGNAVKFDDSGGAVVVSVESAPTGDGRPFVRLRVVDNGPGFPPEDVDVFARFQRAEDMRAKPGSGLGLAIVREIVDRHGGRVWAGNVRGEDGTTTGGQICIDVPVDAPEPAS
jgi:two-component system sensor histidine kinase MprB